MEDQFAVVSHHMGINTLKGLSELNLRCFDVFIEKAVSHKAI